ncbi:MAG: hypothetical protein J7463_17320, partial [Roseiflexus sp.]|nr:hypothetical protein [Roseiflexus sp.]
IDMARDFVLPSYLFEHTLVRELLDAAARTVLWYNDLWSYPKEQSANALAHNIVHILIQEQRLSLYEALDRVITQHNWSLRRFLELKQQIRDFSGENAQTTVFAEHVAAWLRATQDWSHRTNRYRL